MSLQEIVSTVGSYLSIEENLETLGYCAIIFGSVSYSLYVGSSLLVDLLKSNIYFPKNSNINDFASKRADLLKSKNYTPRLKI